MNRAAVILACGCTAGRAVVTEAPAVGAIVYCLYHGNQPIARVHEYEWRVRCMVCRYGRWCGQSETLAKSRARAHMKNNPNHETSVAYDRITKDGKGSILRTDGTRARKLKPADGSARIDSLPIDAPF